MWNTRCLAGKVGVQHVAEKARHFFWCCRWPNDMCAAGRMQFRVSTEDVDLYRYQNMI